VPNFFRKPYGPGSALVGDTAYTKDPTTAQGIADAFVDAERVADALGEVWAGDASFGDANGRHQNDRDAAVLPMYEFTIQLATLEPPPPEMQALLGAMAGNQPAMDAFASVTAGTMSPPEFSDPDHLAGVREPVEALRGPSTRTSCTKTAAARPGVAGYDSSVPLIPQTPLAGLAPG
jgi:hypothetical protein